MLGNLDIIKAVAQYRPISEIGLAINNIEIEITSDEFEELKKMDIPTKQLSIISNCIQTLESHRYDFYDNDEQFNYDDDYMYDYY